MSRPHSIARILGLLEHICYLRLTLLPANGGLRLEKISLTMASILTHRLVNMRAPSITSLDTLLGILLSCIVGGLLELPKCRFRQMMLTLLSIGRPSMRERSIRRQGLREWSMRRRTGRTGSSRMQGMRGRSIRRCPTHCHRRPGQRAIST
ncbi:hypothetical protein BU26DRAFT_232233 [Trematosphaeria pertusa]|uniref:Uncharacterized protein n=1 Tax=Trematosphaeria pertusa TaxID=390896 RepID=A0A6A6IVJ6_9PLEO|nr:uncharacterized protein BU26DRAFT_232233 [Trematosphaeria pertusa]KAF2253942.1 hypothetical protein BU26DRAFT_232233 [Trematosphaeria pertusa]